MAVKKIGTNENKDRQFDQVIKMEPCPHCGRMPVMMKVAIAADLSSTGEEYEKEMPIDACIADLVKALNNGRIKTRGCCCGHGQVTGHISLMDGRYLAIFPDRGVYLPNCPVDLKTENIKEQ